MRLFTLDFAVSFLLPCLALGQGNENLSHSSWPVQSFKSSSARPPSLLIEKTGKTESGLLSFSPVGWNCQECASFVIISDENELIWQSALGTFSSFNPQTLFGNKVLVYWTGTILPAPWGMGIGQIEILDSTYNNIYTVSISGKEQNLVPAAGLDAGKLPSFIDIHEGAITAENTILVTAYNTTEYDLTAFGGPADGWMHDCVLYELDVKTNRVLHRWSALEHIDAYAVPYGNLKYPLGDMGRNKTHPYDFTHINSVDKFRDGSYLISSRHTCAVYRVAVDGTILWVLQGQGGKSSFFHGPGVSFCFQHNARIYRDSGTIITISLFNNDNDFGTPPRVSTALFITLDTVQMTAAVERELTDPAESLFSPAMGNVQSLAHGNTLVGYGYLPYVKEYDAAGNVVMTVQWGNINAASAYRTSRTKWIGKPMTPPAVYACYDGKNTQVYMSWNGSTEHKSWSVMAGNEPRRMSRRKRVPASGFETMSEVTGGFRYVQVEPEGDNVLAINSTIVKVVNC